MKTFKVITFLVVTIATTFSFTSCLNEKYNEVDNAASYSGFDFKTTKEIKVNIKTLTNTNIPLAGVNVELYTKNPLTENGAMIENSENYQLFKGLTFTDGIMTATVAPATSVDSLYALVNYVGLQSFKAVKIGSENEISIVIGGSESQKVKSNVSPLKANADGIWWVSNFWKVNDFYAYATWDSQGVPSNLEATNDVITADFLADINTSLPESKPLTTTHPEYLTSQDDGSIVLVEDAEVWVTFVHEGAGYLNTLAYYSHPTSTPPATKADIKYSTLIFPNVSYSGSGGGLKSGNKVRLLYFDTAKGQYTNIFPAGTTVAWVFRANGWSSGSATVGNGTHTLYSTAAFNPEASTSLKKHNVLLKDDLRKLLLVGFEDMRRDNGSDNDFNDAVFYATVTPYTAVKSGIYQKIDTPKDTDGDGVSDTKDEYPNDPARAYNNYYPSKGTTGSLAFEDLWPYKGDYDFNDLVVDYNFNQITNAQNKVVDIEAKLTVRAIGAHYRNSFAIQFNTPANNVASVTGQSITSNVFTLNQNGTEANQDKAVIVGFDDAFKVFSSTLNGGYINTVNSAAYVTPNTISLKISFIDPVSTTNLGGAPFNPFMVINETRGREVHLAGSAPTSLADVTLFGQGQDDSNLSTGKYYMSDKYLPWALNTPTQFNYPAEKEDITKTHLMFNNWAFSHGATYTDWYSSKSGYRDTQKLYAK